MELISGRRPHITSAKKSIDKLKLRQGMPIGCKVTLRGTLLYLFLDRSMSRILPKLVDAGSTRRPAVRHEGHATAYGMRDLYVHDEISRLGEVDEHLGGFDMVFVYRRRPYLESRQSSALRIPKWRCETRAPLITTIGSASYRRGRTSFGPFRLFDGLLWN